MKIVFLDAKTIGDDIDLSGFDPLGEVVKYGFSTSEQVPERIRDADVIIVNKVPVSYTHLKAVEIRFNRVRISLIWMIHSGIGIPP